MMFSLVLNMVLILHRKSKIVVMLHIAFVMVVKGNFDVTPSNTHVMVGQSTTLLCTVTGAGTGNAQQTWSEYYTNPNEPTIISQDNTVLPNHKSEFSITGIFNLKLLSAQLTHGARYSCTSAWETGPPSAFAEIVVIASDPICSPSIPSDIVIENQVITYSCELTYKGKWAPIMQWRNKNNIPIQSINGSSTNFVKYSISITASKIVHRQQYICTTKFADTLVPPPVGDAATNIPTYMHIYTSNVLTVHWYPTNTQFLDKDNNPITGGDLYPGETIKCVTDSNPAPDYYEWRNMTDNSTLGSTEEIMVDVSWLGTAEMEIGCVVRNAMGGNNGVIGEDITTITVTVKTTTTTTTTTTTVTPTSSTTTDVCVCMDCCKIDTCEATNTFAIVGGVLGSLLTIVCILFGIFILRIYCNPLTKNKDKTDLPGNMSSNTAYQNVDISQEKPYSQLDVNTREEDVNPYRNDYMELGVS